MKTAVIAGIGSALPSKILTNEDLEKIVDTSDEWIRTRTGIRERRIDGDGLPLSHYAVEASRPAARDSSTRFRSRRWRSSPASTAMC